MAWTGLNAIVGRENLRPASTADAVDGIQPSGVIAPGTAQEVAQVLGYCNAAGFAVIPRGSGTKLGLGNRPQKAKSVGNTNWLRSSEPDASKRIPDHNPNKEEPLWKTCQIRRRAPFFINGLFLLPRCVALHWGGQPSGRRGADFGIEFQLQMV